MKNIGARSGLIFGVTVYDADHREIGKLRQQVKAVSNIREFMLHVERMKQRKKRPNAGRPTDDGAENLKRVNVMLDAPTIRNAVAIGEGNLSLGIRRAVATTAKRKKPRHGS